MIPCAGIGFGEASRDGGLGVAIGGGDGIEEIAAFMVNGLACPEMRQYDRPRAIGERVGRGQQGLKFGRVGVAARAEG